MALDSEGGYKRQLTGTLTSPSLPALPLPTLPFELIEEILARLPVKLLLQLRCACKSWNFLISNTKFHKKHLSLSTTHTLHCVSYSFKYVLKSYPLDSLFTNVTTTDIGQLKHSLCNVSLVGSCNGILCLAVYYVGSALIQFRLWNPSIRKLKELPPDKNSRDRLPLRVCSRFSDIKPLIDLNRQSLNSQFLFVGREKMSKNPYRDFGFGGWFRIGKVLNTLNDFGTPKEPLT
ncbi:F-box and associated interaction domain protein [Medicago truncatula]|uniref:F-box and associated interaction domain protein n=1 Tax=Medicago truncatula TaxID=3880 RepID=G7IV89_MEDTR|nr:F-box and associated interaction domain protein [Medicago truncatula]